MNGLAGNTSTLESGMLAAQLKEEQNVRSGSYFMETALVKCEAMVSVSFLQEQS